MTLSLIVNPTAGGGRAGRLLPAVRETLGRLELEHRVQLTRSLDHARELARAAARDGEQVVVFGGDGTVGAVAGELRDTGAVLGVLPGGRGNDFARMIGLPRSPITACATLADGQIIAVDLGEATPGRGETTGCSDRAAARTFLGIATTGFDSEANRIANGARLIPDGLVYAYGGVRALLSWRPVGFTLTLDGVQHSLYGYNVAVANSAYHGAGMRLAPGASLHDGMFDVVMVAQARKRDFLCQLPRVFRGSHVDCSFVRVLRAHEVQLACEHPYTTYADGDPLTEPPVTFRVCPGALRVKAPRDAACEREEGSQ